MITKLILSTALAASPVVRKETQADRIEKRLIRVESILERQIRDATSRRGMVRRYNQCNQDCTKRYPWDDSQSETEAWKLERSGCYEKCKLPDDFLSE